jgi:hypothetical protein
MAGRCKYTKELISKGKQMRKRGFSWNVIVAELGFTSINSAKYYIKEGMKERLILNEKLWQKKNRQRYLNYQSNYQSLTK